MNKNGFTLVELLAVIAILALLVIIALPNVLKMFNDAKKNSFLTEAKIIYKESTNKYISELMNGNKLSYISFDDNTKLDTVGRDLQYCIFLKKDGTVESMKVSNKEWVIDLPPDKKIIDLTINDLKEGNLDDYSCLKINTVSFAEDSWETISNAVKKGQTGNYNLGDTKVIDVGSYGTYTVRIVNKDNPNECNDGDFSQTACGFVIEFSDIVSYSKMKEDSKSEDGWPSTKVRTLTNNSIYNSLPDDLKSIIIDTKVVSGHGKTDSENFTSTDKLYLFSPTEIYGNGYNEQDSAKEKTRQLDYYKKKNVTASNNYGLALKSNPYWLRTALSDYEYHFYNIEENFSIGVPLGLSNLNAGLSSGISPAFRIG